MIYDLNTINNAIYINRINNTNINIINDSIISNLLNQVNSVIYQIDKLNSNTPNRDLIIDSMISNLDNVKTTITNCNTLISKIPGFLDMLQQNVIFLKNSDFTLNNYNQMMTNITISRENATTSQDMYGHSESFLSSNIQILIGLQMKKLDIIKNIKELKKNDNSINFEMSLQNIVDANNETDINKILQQLLTPIVTTTPVPTTQIPTTPLPTKQIPTTQVPTTQILTTQPPTKQIPTTQVPTTQILTTQVPTTQVSTTQIPTTQVPTTQISTTQVPTTQIPTTQIPTTQIPTTQIPTTQVPTTQVPTTQISTTQVPTTQVPTTQISTTQVPTTQVPTRQIPITQEVPLISENYTFITSLKLPASKGETKIYVEDDSKFKIGDSIQIGSDDITIAKVIGFGSLILDTPLKFNYSGNVPVGIIKDKTSSNNYTIYIIISIIVYTIILLVYYYVIMYIFSNYK
jgi:hypothetical protein